eukprot:TRINITY_DN9608_c0_g1_i1.p1 TRINITY_DN9608_c0_g1~~TRINITY_DN9608_c0_g1_i1.p1  ORF type:complete len:573 (+),score=143.91 TRINITY_DN9608_c0_g1_i1:207-1925(+)
MDFKTHEEEKIPPLPILLKQLSYEAAAGHISVEKKNEIKSRALDGEIEGDELTTIVKELAQMNKYLSELVDGEELEAPEEEALFPLEECKEIQSDEIVMIQSVFDVKIIEMSDKMKVLEVNIVPHLFGESYSVKARVMIPSNYPNAIPLFEVELDIVDSTMDDLTKPMDITQLFRIKKAQLGILSDEICLESMTRIGTPMLFDLITYFSGALNDAIEANVRSEVNLKIKYDQYKKADSIKKMFDGILEFEDDTAAKIIDLDLLYGSSLRKDSLDITNPLRYVTNIAKIFNCIGIRSIKRFETIIRLDLANAFNKEWKKVRSKYSHLDKYKQEPQLVFHGTNSHAVASIVANGLVAGGVNDVGVGVKNGTAFGNGVYLAKTFSFAQSYCKVNRRSVSDRKMVICATLLGGSFDYAEYPNFYVVKNPKRVLPLFVVHFDSYPSTDGEYIGMRSGYFIKGYSLNDQTKQSATEKMIQTGEREAARKRAEFYFDSSTIDEIEEMADIGGDDDDTCITCRDSKAEASIVSQSHEATFNDYRFCEKPGKAFFVDPALIDHCKTKGEKGGRLLGLSEKK